MYNKIYFIIPLLYCHFCSNAQEYNKTPCPIPTPQQTKEVCGSISLNEQVKDEELDYYIYGWEKRILKIACADPKTEKPEIVKEKVRSMWEKHHSLFSCQYQENILKFAYERMNTQFGDHLVKSYGININLIDPYDGKNVYDYLKDKFFFNCALNGKSHALTEMYSEYLKKVYELGGRPGPKSDWGPGRKVRGHINNFTPTNAIGEIIEVDVDVAEIKVKIISTDEKFKPNGKSLSKGMELWLSVENWKLE